MPELGITEQAFVRWRAKALEGMESALADRAEHSSGEAVLERKLDDAERTIGRLALENDLLGRASRRLP